MLLGFRSCSVEDRALSSWVALAIAADSEVPVAEPSSERFRVWGLRFIGFKVEGLGLTMNEPALGSDAKLTRATTPPAVFVFHPVYEYSY